MTDATTPAHYHGDGMQAIDAIRAAGYAEGFNLGNVIKYVWRYAPRVTQTTCARRKGISNLRLPQPWNVTINSTAWTCKSAYRSWRNELRELRHG